MQSSWVCPFCATGTLPGPENSIAAGFDFDFSNVRGPHRVDFDVMVCGNQECGEFVLEAALVPAEGAQPRKPGRRAAWRLIPDPSHREEQGGPGQPLPDYIPGSIREDHAEAYAIRMTSPRASAALARGALYGMITDFWDLPAADLDSAVRAVREEVDEHLYAALDRAAAPERAGTGPRIVPLGPHEPESLIVLIERLAREWYATHQERASQVEDLLTAIEGTGDDPESPEK